MGVDRNGIAEFVRINSNIGDARQVTKFMLRLGLKGVFILLVTLVVANIVPHFDVHTFNRVVVLVVINVYALLLGIGMCFLSIRASRKEINDLMKPPKIGAPPSKLKIIIASMAPVSGLFGMYFGRIFLSNMSQNSALLVILFSCAILHTLVTFAACRPLYIAYLIWRFYKT